MSYTTAFVRRADGKRVVTLIANDAVSVFFFQSRRTPTANAVDLCRSEVYPKTRPAETSPKLTSDLI